MGQVGGFGGRCCASIFGELGDVPGEHRLMAPWFDGIMGNVQTFIDIILVIALKLLCQPGSEALLLEKGDKIYLFFFNL